MSITYPRSLPSLGVANCAFLINRVDYAAPTNGGRGGGVQAGLPLWQLDIGVAPRTEIEYEQWRAWITSLRGQIRLFYGYDITRPYPLAHPGGLSGTGACSGWTTVTDRDMITLSGCPATKLQEGDYIGLTWSTGKTVAMVTQGGTVSGGAVTCSIEPPLPSLVDPAATAYLNKPTCIMRIDPQNTQIGARGVQRTGPIQFRGVQDLSPQA